MLLILNVIFVLVAVAMIALILMQRGAGAQAGSGFGGGASATVFGARGSASFLTKATKWLAVVFFAITFFMAWQATRGARVPTALDTDLGLMSEGPVSEVPAAPQADQAVPAAPEVAVPEEAAQSSGLPAVDDAAVPVAPEPDTDEPVPGEG